MTVPLWLVFDAEELVVAICTDEATARIIAGWHPKGRRELIQVPHDAYQRIIETRGKEYP